jgi:hypothetical protein
MASHVILKMIDNYSPTQFGENGHVEYGWSNSFQEKIIQFHFQLTRTNEVNIESLKMQLDEILCSLKTANESKNNIECVMSIIYLRTLYKMIGHTRDIIHGKGEYALTYMMIYTWYQYYPELALYALETLVTENPCGVHPYGSWKDIKYFCNYCRMQGCDVKHPLIVHAILLVNSELFNDMKILEEGFTNISLVSKWVPREKSAKFGWLYEYLACDYFANYMLTTSQSSYDKAVSKCKMEYRKMLSHMNRIVDTVQIKQCNHIWSEINFKNVTSITTTKQKKAFLNVLYNGKPRYELNKDRNDCAQHFKEYLSECQNGKTNVKGKRVSLCDFTEHALKLLDEKEKENENENENKETIKTEIDILNSQWRDNASQNSSFGKMIPMVDVSSSMDGKPLHAAIALGIRVAEKSIFGKRVLTFSAYPSWVNLEGKETFVEMVDELRNANWGMNTNFYAALDMILDAIVEAKMSPEDVEDIVLAVFSDMQIDHADNNSFTMYTQIKQKYEITGLRLHGKPFKPPHILFWNLRSTNGFPNLSSQAHTSMLSGFSPVLLNLFEEQGIEAMQSCTPWVMLETILSNPRYKILEKRGIDVFTNHINV